MVDQPRDDEETTCRIRRRAARYAKALAALEAKSVGEFISDLIEGLGRERFGEEDPPKQPPKKRR
jgi:DNA-directed RNA polymerase subunit F